jgi:hypothetical protein
MSATRELTVQETVANPEALKLVSHEHSEFAELYGANSL